MNGGRRFGLALVTTMLAVVMVAGLALVLAYDLATERQQALLTEVAGGHARILRAQFPANAEVDADTAISAFNATGSAAALGPGGEVLLVRAVGRVIQVLARLPATGESLPGPIEPASPLGRPSRAAVEGRSGFVTGPDYRGVMVMAAVEPIPRLGMAVVAKARRADVRAPFYRMTMAVAVVAACMILAAALTASAFGRAGGHDRRRLEALVDNVLESVPEGALLLDAGDGRVVAANSAFASLMSDAAIESIDELVFDDAERGAILAGAIDDGHPMVFERDGEVVPVGLTVRALTLGERKAVLVFFRNQTVRERLEEAVVDAENRYRTLFEHPTEMVAILDAEGFIDCNRNAARTFGLASRAEAVGRHPAEYCPEFQPDGTPSLAGFDARVARALDDAPQRFDWTFLRAEGAPFVVEITLAPFEMREGRALIAIARDVDERVRAVEALRRDLEDARTAPPPAPPPAPEPSAEAIAEPAAAPPAGAPAPPDRFRQVFENSLVGTALIDMENRILAANPALCAFLGYEPGDIAGTSFLELVHVEDRASNERRLNALRAGTSDHFTLEKRFMRRDGKPLWASLRLTLARGADSDSGCLIAQIDDINDRRLAQQALAESERRYRSLIDNNPDSVVVLRDHVIVFANAAANAMFGAGDPDGLIGRDVFDLIAPEDRSIIATRMENVIATHEPSPLSEFGFLRLDGSQFTAEVTGATIRWRGTSAIQSVIRDVSRRKHAEDHVRRLHQELAHMSRLSSLGEMATGFAHEINQPLAAIANFARGRMMNLSTDAADVDATRQTFRNIEEQALRAGEIVRRIRGFIQKREPERREFDLNEAIRESAALLHGEAARHDVTMALDLADSLPPAWGDALQVQQIVLNLGRNAIDAMAGAGSPRRELTIRTQPGPESNVEIVVEDTGPGIPDETRPDIFKPFFTTKETGLGMGLAISRTIAEGLGGRLKDDPAFETGARMVLTIPAATRSIA